MPVEPRRIVWALLRRRKIIWLTTFLGAAAGVAAALTWAPREFASSAIFAWDATAGRAEGVDTMRELRTMVDSVKTPSVLAEIRKRLGLTATLEAIAARLDVVANERSNLITVSAVAPTPEQAVDLARVTIDAFQQQRLVFEKARRSDNLRQLEASLAGANQDLAKLRATYEEFRKAEHVTDLTAEVTQALSDVARLEQQQVSAKADSMAEQARLDWLEEAQKKRPGNVVLSEKTVRPQGTKLADVEAELAGLRSGGLSADHPRLAMLEAEAKALRADEKSWKKSVVTERNEGRNPQLEAIEGRIAEASAAREAALARERALSQLGADANANLERLRVVEGKAGELLRTLRATEAHVSELEGRRAAAMDAARSPASMLTLLEPPEAPSRPRKSLRKLVAAACTVLGLLFGVLYVVAGALRGLRVHTASEAAFWGRAPTVYSSEWPIHGEADDVKLDLAAQLDSAPGTTLIVPAGTQELALARELAALANWPAHDPESKARVQVWLEDAQGPALRRAVRSADRVLLMVGAGEHSGLKLAQLPGRIGAERSYGFALLGVAGWLSALPDTCGDANSFWNPRKDGPRLRVVASA
ncbi:MAG: hypothetical protein JST92_11735 [Deltaproteobacteria bacterium]|nr:hypothetical protein [Deltaproteobacteria bacterium]